jgi:hypothetical protein
MSCEFCGWSNEQPQSHITYGNWKCQYITNTYNLNLDDDGDIEFSKKYKKDDGCEYVIKTWNDNKDYLGLFEFDNKKSWLTEQEAREYFDWAIYKCEFKTIELVKIDIRDNNRETILETEYNEKEEEEEDN